MKRRQSELATRSQKGGFSVTELNSICNQLTIIIKKKKKKKKKKKHKKVKRYKTINKNYHNISLER